MNRRDFLKAMGAAAGLAVIDVHQAGKIVGVEFGDEFVPIELPDNDKEFDDWVEVLGNKYSAGHFDLIRHFSMPEPVYAPGPDGKHVVVGAIAPFQSAMDIELSFSTSEKIPWEDFESSNRIRFSYSGIVFVVDFAPTSMLTNPYNRDPVLVPYEYEGFVGPGGIERVVA